MATAAAPPQTNGNGVSVLEKPPAGVTQQLSYSGTPRGPDGVTYPDEYVAELRNPLTRMLLFEEMRASDGAIHTAIESRLQVIKSANWQISSADSTPNATEQLEFVEDNIYPLLDDLLRLLAGGALHVGFGALEPIFDYNDRPFSDTLSRGRVKRATKSGAGQRIYLKKLAHIRQPSVETFRIAVTGDLIELWQYAFNGVTFQRAKIPGSKLLLWSYNKQGDDHWGIPPTRHCFKAWKIKSQLERLNLLHFDRFGVGVPKLTEPPGGLSENERTIAARGLKNLRSSGENFFIGPNGTQLEILTATGDLSTAGLEWAKHYNLEIAKVFLTQGTELGSTETGARALGEVFYQQLEGIVQADCEELAAIINNGLIVPLIRWNFGEQDAYPVFAPSQRVRATPAIGQLVQTLITSGSVHWRDEDEVWLRDVCELPPVTLDELTKREAENRAKALEIAKATPTPDPNAPPPDPNAPPAEKPAPPKPPLKVAAHRNIESHVHALAAALADGAPDPAMPGETTHRTTEFTAWEQGVLRPDVLMQQLDLQTARLTGEVQDVLAAIDADLERQATMLAANGPTALAASVKSLAVPERLRRQLRVVMLEAANRTRDYGASAVRQEIIRQLGPDASAVGPQRDRGPGAPFHSPYENMGPSASFRARVTRNVWRLFRALAQGTNEKTPEQLHLEAEVDRAVEDEIDRREGSARSSVLNAIAQGARVPDQLASIVAAGIAAALLSLSTNRTSDNVSSVVNTAFGIGRTEEAQAINAAVSPSAPSPSRPSSGGTPADNAPAPSGGGRGGRSGLLDAAGNPIELVAKVYSAVMDRGTCDECAKWDGARFPIDYPEDITGVQCPNPRCAGGYGRCRCVWIWIVATEQASNVPSSKGPIPLTQPIVDPILALKQHLDEALEAQRAEILTKITTQAGALPQPIVINLSFPGGKSGPRQVTDADGKVIYELRADPSDTAAGGA